MSLISFLDVVKCHLNFFKMQSSEDSSCRTSTNDEYSDTDDNIIGYHRFGAKASSTKEIWDSLADMCKRSIASKFRVGKEKISMDLDAYSFVVSADEMNCDRKEALREFLLSFGGMSFGRCNFPTRCTGSKSKDSIFGCAGNESQHLPHVLRGNEMLVIDAPVKIALHASCQSSLITNLKTKGFYYLPSSIKTGVCFNPSAAANKPPYAVIVDAIVESCDVPSQVTGNTKPTNIIHVADMGFRSPLANNFDAIHNLFTKCKNMEQTGLIVELTQFDVAFVFEAPQDHLIQASCKLNEVHGKDSLLQKSQVTVYPLHKLPKFKNEKLKTADLRGTFEIKKTKWKEGRNVIFDDETYNSCIHLFSSSNVDESLGENISIHSSTLHSVKGYSTIAHQLLQKRSKYLMQDKAMYGVGHRKFEYIQTLIANATLSLNETFHTVKSHGIGFRIEVSLRPHFSDPLRYSRHGNDLLLIVSLSLQELCGSKCTIRLTTFPTRSVQTEAMKLLSEVTSMVHYRKDIRFNQVYSDEKVIEWLRSHLSILMITIGICPGYGIKYVNQWLSDEERFDPHDKVSGAHPRCQNDSLILIQNRMLQSFERRLKYLRFAERAVQHLRRFLEKAPNLDPMSCFSSLSLRSKHLLVNCLWTDIIPHLSEFLSQDKNKVRSSGIENVHDEIDTTYADYEDSLDMLEPSELRSDKILDDLMEKAPMPVHPLAVAIMSLLRLSLLWNPNRLGFNQILLHYVLACHANENLGYDEITDQKTLGLIHDCLKGTKLTRDDLRCICLHLIPSCATRNQPIISYQRMLSKHYQFPISDIGCTPTGNLVERMERNAMINLALTQDLSVLVFHDHQKALFHRISENTNVEVILQSRVLRMCNEFEYSTTFQHHNLYCMMANILTSKSEACLREILFDRMTRSKRRLQDIFLTNEGNTSKSFKKIDTLKDLEQAHQFGLRKVQDTILNLVMSTRYEPEIVLSLVSYVYQKNIVFYNSMTEITRVFMYWKSRSIKYETRGCNWLPTIKSVIVRLDDDKVFKRQEIIESVSTLPMINKEASELFSTAPIGGRLSSEIRLNLLSNRRRTSSGLHFFSALSKLLNQLDEGYLENSDHGNWSSDCLGLKSFCLELSQSGLSQHQCFHHSVMAHCELLSLPLRILANWLLRNHFDEITHKLLCPLLCLKHHNLMFGVFDYNEGKKETYFYAHNPFLNIVEMKRYPNFIRLIDRSRTLYVYSSPSRSEYFVPEEILALNHENVWSWDSSITGKYSHLSINKLENCLDQLKVTYNANIFKRHEEMEDYNWRPEYPVCVIKTSELTDRSKKLLFLSHSGIPHISLILIFPTSRDVEEWDICIVHHPNQDEDSALSHLLAFIENSPAPGIYHPTCIKGRTVEHCESGFYMMLYAYLAFESKLLQNFLISMRAVNHEPDLKMKSQQWIQATMRTQSRVTLPWMTQLTWESSLTNPLDERRDSLTTVTDSDDQDQNSLQENTMESQRLRTRRREMSWERNRRKRTRPSTVRNEQQVEHCHVDDPNFTGNPNRSRGLKNPSNLCYMNVTIQLLYGMKCIRNHISEINSHQNQNVSMALKCLFHSMTSNQVPTSVVEFKKAIVLNSPFQDFANSHQQDSHQFLITLLQSISDEFASHHQDSIPFWFRSTLLSRVQCQTCRRVSTNEGDHSTSIEVEIFGNSLEDCLMNFFQHEVIDNQWICDHCNIERRAFKYLLLQERPILIITLKRFTGESQKISTNVKFPIDNLSVPNLVNERNKECNTTRYNLFAVVNHLGVSSTSGHYTLYMRDDKKWLKFDDENVVQIRKERVISSNAYTLVYIQKEKYKILGS